MKIVLKNSTIGVFVKRTIIPQELPIREGAIIQGGNMFLLSSSYTHSLIELDGETDATLVKDPSTPYAQNIVAFAFLTEEPTTSSIPFADSRKLMEIYEGSRTESIPANAKYLYISRVVSGEDRTPQSIILE